MNRNFTKTKAAAEKSGKMATRLPRLFIHLGNLKNLMLILLLTMYIGNLAAENKGQISFSTTYSSSITPANTFDRYTIVLPMPGMLSVNITSGTLPPYAVEMQLLNSNNTWMDGSNGGFTFPYTYNYGNGNINLPAGTYHIEITQRSGNPGYVGTYNIRVDCSVAETKPNNTIATAQLLPFGYTVNAEITSIDDAGMFKYILTEPGRLPVTLI